MRHRSLSASRHFVARFAFATTCLVGLLPEHSSAEELPVSPERRAFMMADFARTISELDPAIKQAPDRVELYSRRGDAHLFLGQFAQAVADFEKMIALDPAQDAPHWRLGIAYYFNRDFAKSAQQFQKYHAHDGRDRENGIWKFLAQAKHQGIEKARAEMLPYTQFDREPFPMLYEMFAGRKTDDDFATSMTRDEVRENKAAQFFANYYLGLYEHLLGDDIRAREHIGKAVRLFGDARERGGPGYMWQVARLHYDALTAAQSAP